MPLLTPGHWHSTHFQANHWHDLHWQNFGLGVPIVQDIFIECPPNVWTKVATSVSTGVIWKVIDTEYLFTYRLTGESAPTLESDGVRVFKDDDSSENELIIKSYELIDIYLFSKSKVGRIRADL